MAHKEFAVAVTQQADDRIERDPITFTLAGDDFIYKVRSSVKEDALALVWARMVESNGLATLSRIEDVIRRMLEPASADHLLARIEDRYDTGDPLGLEHVAPAIKWVVEEYAGRPTESSSA